MTIVAKWAWYVLGAWGVCGITGGPSNGSQLVARPKMQEIRRAEKVVDEVFGKDIVRAKTAQEKAKLAQEILRTAREEQDMAVRFAALQAASRLTVEALDGKLGLEIIQEIVQTYEPLEDMPKEDRLAEADRFWEQAERAQGREKLAKQLEAAEAYLYLLPTAAGLTKNKIERRLSELGENGLLSPVDIRNLQKEVLLYYSFEPHTIDARLGLVRNQAQNSYHALARNVRPEKGKKDKVFFY